MSQKEFTGSVEELITLTAEYSSLWGWRGGTVASNKARFETDVLVSVKWVGFFCKLITALMVVVFTSITLQYLIGYTGQVNAYLHLIHGILIGHITYALVMQSYYRGIIKISKKFHQLWCDEQEAESLPDEYQSPVEAVYVAEVEKPPTVEDVEKPPTVKAKVRKPSTPSEPAGDEMDQKLKEWLNTGSEEDLDKVLDQMQEDILNEENNDD